MAAGPGLGGQAQTQSPCSTTLGPPPTHFPFLRNPSAFPQARSIPRARPQLWHRRPLAFPRGFQWHLGRGGCPPATPQVQVQRRVSPTVPQTRPPAPCGMHRAVPGACPHPPGTCSRLGRDVPALPRCPARSHGRTGEPAGSPWVAGRAAAPGQGRAGHRARRASARQPARGTFNAGSAGSPGQPGRRQPGAPVPAAGEGWAACGASPGEPLKSPPTPWQGCRGHGCPPQPRQHLLTAQPRGN